MRISVDRGEKGAPPVPVSTSTGTDPGPGLKAAVCICRRLHIYIYGTIKVLFRHLQAPAGPQHGRRVAFWG